MRVAYGIVAGALLGVGAFASSALAADLRVKVVGATPGRGQILASLFTKSGDWMLAPSSSLVAAVDARGEASFLLPDRPPGAYAISVIYDEDGDGSLDVTASGRPAEPVGYSNNAGAAAAPTWLQARFLVTDEPVSVTIRLRRP